MKKTEIAKIRTMSEAQLEKEINEDREALRAMKFDLSAGKVKNISSVRELRKKIARMMTFAEQYARNTQNGK